MKCLAIAALTAAVGTVFALPAQAVIKIHDLEAGPAARCQPNTSSYAASVSHKALALQNIGASSIFVTCAFEFEHIVDQAAPSNPTNFYALSVWFANHATADLTVKCTAVTGHETGSNQYVSKSVLIAPGMEGNINWLPADFPLGFDNGGGVVAITCTLPPGSAFNDTHIAYTLDDGTAPPT